MKNVTNKTGGGPNKQIFFEKNGMGKCPVSFHDRWHIGLTKVLRSNLKKLKVIGIHICSIKYGSKSNNNIKNK